MRETIGTYSTKTYSKLHSISELVVPRTVGKSTVWTDNPSFDLEHQVTRLHMTKIPKESADQKGIVWYYHGSCMPKTLRWSKTTLLGGSTWLSKCVRALHFPWFWSRSWKRKCVKLLGHILRRPTPSYIRSTSELVVPRTFGKSTEWTDNPSFDLEHQVTRLHMTKIPKESADQKGIVWYYHGSCMPKTLRGSKAILLGGSTWLSKCVRALHFPWFWSRSWKRKCVKLLGHILRRPTPSYIRSISELVIPRTVGKSTVWTDNPSFDLEHREARLKCRWPRFPKNLQLKKIAFDIIKGPACPRHCEGPRLLFLEGAHDWANVFVLCISHCLVLKQVLKEKMRETIGTYSTKTYSRLHSISELVIPRTVGKSTV